MIVRETPCPVKRTRRPKTLLIASALYLAASAFGVLRVPGIDLTYANLALVLLCVASIRAGRFVDLRPFFVLASIMALDLLFRAYQSRMSDVGYSVNIGKMAVFALLAQQLAAFDTKDRGILAVAFGVAAVASEFFALAYPTYREELYSSQVMLDDVENLSGLLYRPTGLIGDPNYFAIPLVLMAAALFTRKQYAWFWVVALLVLITGSRAALVAVFVPIAVQQIFRARARPLLLLFYLISLVGIYLLAAWFNSILRGDTGDSNTERTLLLQQGINNVLSLSFLNATYGQPLGLGIGGDALVVHNTYLQTAVTSVLLAAYLLYRSVAGMLRSPHRLILAGLIIEMLFLDVSSFSSIIFAFFIFSEGCRRTKPTPRNAEPAQAAYATRRLHVSRPSNRFRLGMRVAVPTSRV